MSTRFLWVIALLSIAPVPAAMADAEPFLSVEAGGPTAQVTGMAFSPDGQKLYVAGFDKVVRVYLRNAQGKYELEPSLTFRVPIGPGLIGSIFDLALSPDGNWLAVGGRGVVRNEAGFREGGVIWPKSAMTDAMQADQGVIYLWNTKTREVRQLRGHKGMVIGLAFASTTQGEDPPPLVSFAAEGEDLTTGACFLWDIAKGNYRRYPRPLTANEFRPGLIAWHDSNTKQLRVGISWREDGLLRVWDVTSNKVWEEKIGMNNQALAYLADQDLVLTGSYANGNGLVRSWRVSGEKAEMLREKKFAARNDGKLLTAPQVMSLFASRPGGKMDSAVVALNVLDMGSQPAKGSYEILLMDVSADDFGEEKARLRLWEGQPLLPVLAVSSGQRCLALTGPADQAARVYDLDDLLKSRPRVKAKLQGIGNTLVKVGFARHSADGRPGLTLSSAGDPSNGIVFDFARRDVAAAAPRAWLSDDADQQGWLVREESKKIEEEIERWVIVSRNAEVVGRVPLASQEHMIAAAVLPMCEVLGRPLVALALRDRGTPVLRLYDASTGVALRQYSGHMGAISSLAFDKKGRLLASVAADETVCIWSLTDLNQIINRRGFLRGVTVRKSDQGDLVIGRIDGRELDKENGGKLQAGDVLEAMSIGDQKPPLSSPDSFYGPISAVKPGQNITLTLSGKGDVRLRVGQAMDERKPLFSLFIAEGEPGASATGDVRHWIGWSPMGPYEASGKEAEKYLGWHFNLGRADKPTSFAAADEYRGKYSYPGLLKELVERGSLTDVWPPKPKPLPPLQLTLLVTEGNQEHIPDDQGEVIVRRPDITLKVRPSGPPLDKVSKLTWQQGEQAPQSLDARNEEDFASPKLAPRQPTELRVEARTQEEHSQIVTRTLTIRYVPAAPKITVFEIADRPREEPSCRVKGAVTAERPVKISLLDDGRAVQDLKTEKTPQGWQFDQTIKVTPGTHAFILQATNEGADEPFLREEMDATKTWEVIHVPKKVVPPPSVSGLQLQSIDQPDAPPWPLVPGQLVRVTAGHVRLRGRLKGEANLTEAKFTGQGSLSGFAAGQGPLFAINEEIHLKPGKQELELMARCQDSEPNVVKLAIEFQPPLPQLTLLSPERNTQVTLGAQKANVVPLLADLAWPPNPQPCHAEVRLNGKTLTTIALTSEKGQLAYDVPLERLEPKHANLLQVVLHNEWNARQESEVRAVHYLRPPQDLELRVPKTVGKPFLDAAVTAQSPADLPLRAEDVNATINGRAHPTGKIHVSKTQAGAAGRYDQWTITLRDVPLQENKNTLVVKVRNAEGDSLREAAASVDFVPEKRPDPAVITWLRPVSNQVTRPFVEVAWRVESATRLRRTALLVNGEPVPGITPGPSREGNATVFQHTISLLPGATKIGVEVENDAGLQTHEEVINYVQPAVRLVMRAPAAVGARELKTEGKDKPRWVSVLAKDSSTDGRVKLDGEIVFDQPLYALPADCRIQVFVNGFLQPEVAPRPPEDPKAPINRLTFSAFALLTEVADNRIELRTNLPQELGDQTSFVIDCDHPADRIRVHLLMIADAAEAKKTEEALKQIAAKAFAGRGKAIELDVETLSGNGFRENHVVDRILKIQEQMKTAMTNRTGRTSEMLVIYYHGHEYVSEQHGLYWATDFFNRKLKRPQDALKSSTLQDILDKDCPGARVLLFDVAGVQKQADGQSWKQIASWSDNAAVLHLINDQSAADAPGRLLGKWEEGARQAKRLQELADFIDRALYNGLAAPPQQSPFRKKLSLPLQYLPVGGGS